MWLDGLIYSTTKGYYNEFLWERIDSVDDKFDRSILLWRFHVQRNYGFVTEWT